MTIKLSIVRKKKGVLLNVTKVRSEVMLVLHNVIMEMSNLRIKNRVPPNVTNAGQQINNGFLLFGENNSLARAGEVLFMA